MAPNAFASYQRLLSILAALLATLLISSSSLAQQPIVANLPDAPMPQQQITDTSSPTKESRKPTLGTLSRRSFFFPDLAHTEKPLTSGQKFLLATDQSIAPSALLVTAATAAVNQARNSWPGYGQGWESYGKRYGASLADSESGVFFTKFLLPVLLRQDPRYFRMREGSKPRRAAYAVSRIFVTRTDDGANTFNTSHVLGRFIAKAIANSYYPQRDRGWRNTLINTGNGLLSDAGTYLFKEFWPDLRQKVVPRRFRRDH